mgnify:CR=1 FL=1
MLTRREWTGGAAATALLAAANGPLYFDLHIDTQKAALLGIAPLVQFGAA